MSFTLDATADEIYSKYQSALKFLSWLEKALGLQSEAVEDVAEVAPVVEGTNDLVKEVGANDVHGENRSAPALGEPPTKGGTEM